MATPLDSKDLVTLQEFTISNMWEVVALIERVPQALMVREQLSWTELCEITR